MFHISKSKHLNFLKASNLLHRKSKFDVFKDKIQSIFFKRRKKERRYLKVLFVLFAIFFLLFSIFFSFKLIKTVNIFFVSKNKLELSLQEIKKNNFSKGVILASEAENGFKIANQEIKKIDDNFFIRHIPYINSNINDLYYISEISCLASSMVKDGAIIGDKISSDISKKMQNGFSKFSEEDKKNVLKNIYESRHKIRGIQASLNLALLDFNEIKLKGVFSLFDSKFQKLKIRLSNNMDSVKQVINFLELVPKLAGYPRESNFLVVFQNSDELRATGGFIGTYGLLNTKNGDIKQFSTHDIYNLDKPVENILNINPPEPISKYLQKKWFMRDANWNPDWPTTANKLQWFYNQESDSDMDFDGIFAINSEFAVDLLRLVEPVKVDGVEFYANSFVDLLEYKVEREYIKQNKEEYERKEIIGDILKEVKIKFFDLSYKELFDVVSVVNNNILGKDLMLFFDNDYYQDIAQNMGMAGEMKNVTGDYLMVVDSNMRAFKTDSQIKRNIKYELVEEKDGLFANLEIEYKHSGKENWKISDYRDYVRVYVPMNSELVDMNAYGFYQFSKKEFDVGVENGKKFFATFFALNSGATGKLQFKYKLPNEIYNGDEYSLYLQKQSGVISNFSIDIDLLNDVKLYSNQKDKHYFKDIFSISGKLNSDRLFDFTIK